MRSHVTEGYMITHELCHMAGQYQGATFVELLDNVMLK